MIVGSTAIALWACCDISRARVGIEHNRMWQYQGRFRREYVREEAGHQVRNVFSRKEVVRSSGKILTKLTIFSGE